MILSVCSGTPEPKSVRAALLSTDRELREFVPSQLPERTDRVCAEVTTGLTGLPTALMARNHYLLLSDFLLPRWESPLPLPFVSNVSSHPDML